jgi:hypothetical protein
MSAATLEHEDRQTDGHDEGNKGISATVVIIAPITE